MLHKDFQLLKEGDPSALVHIHAEYSRRIFWVGKGLIKDEFVIETLVQDTFLKLWENRESIQTPEHIFYFLRFVMKRECISYYSRPKNKFFRKVISLENQENYQDHLVGYDPTTESERQQHQESDQKDFDRIKKVLPLLDTDKRRLIELCLKYGFRYKAIAQVMGMSVTQTSNQVKRAIGEVKTIIEQGSKPKTGPRPVFGIKVMTGEQKRVLELRCEKKYSFSTIAAELNLSQQEVHREFLAAYKLMQEKHQQQEYGKVYA